MRVVAAVLLGPAIAAFIYYWGRATIEEWRAWRHGSAVRLNKKKKRHDRKLGVMCGKLKGSEYWNLSAVALVPMKRFGIVGLVVVKAGVLTPGAISRLLDSDA